MNQQGPFKMPIDVYVIDKVKELRILFHMSQAVLAAKMEVDDSFIARIENPKHRAKYNVAHINKLAKIFGCSPRDLLPEQPVE